MDLQGQEAGEETTDRQHESKEGDANSCPGAQKGGSRSMAVILQKVQLCPRSPPSPPRQLAASSPRLQCTEEGKGLKGTEGGNMKV